MRQRTCGAQAEESPGEVVLISLTEDFPFDYDPEKIAPFIAEYKGKLKLVTGGKPYFLYRFSPGEIRTGSSSRQTLDICLSLCRHMKTLVADND